MKSTTVPIVGEPTPREHYLEFTGFSWTVDKVLEEPASGERVTIETMTGCTGTHLHADFQVKIYYDAAGRVEYAEEVGCHGVRRCDESCRNKPANGSFIIR